MLRSPTKLVANIPPGVGADSSRPYPNIFKYAYPFHRIRISTLSNTHIHVIKYTYPFHRIRISVSHFVGVYVYAGTMNRPLRLRTVCDNVAFTHEIGYEHSARRRGRFIAPVSWHYQIYISISTNMCFRIIKYAFPFPISWVYSYTRAR